MHREFLMGNQAAALGAVAAGLEFVSGYPGTPSTEALETVAKINKDKNIYVEWSVNEKAALEAAAGAALSGARSMVTMKQVGLNVASDPLMSLSYIGVKGGMVIYVADDPGPISSQTEQDTRTFAMYSKLPVFDPADIQEAYDMIGRAFDLSEEYHTPVIFRPTTRICHAYASVNVKDEDEYISHSAEGFIKDASKWVIFPALSRRNHAAIEKRNRELSDRFSDSRLNEMIPARGVSGKGIITGGISFSYVKEALAEMSAAPAVLKVATPFPFPEKLALSFIKDLDEVLCVEELDPVLERALIYTAGKYGIKLSVRGKNTDDAPLSGENSVDSVKKMIASFTGEKAEEMTQDENVPPLPVRPPVLCPGCPHRASFYAVKKAMRGKNAVFCGDIGCYTLGNAAPLDMVDTCLCMGAGVNMAQGIGRFLPDTACFAFVGDSTFFASAVSGAINGVYNGADMTLVILDNSTTAMTGHQPHPGTGRTMMGDITQKIDPAAVLGGIGVKTVEICDPFDLAKAVDTVKRVSALPGVKAIIFKSPCAMLVKPEAPAAIDSGKCTNCKACINQIGCPGLISENGRTAVDPSLCTGCGLCTQICPFDAISITVEGGKK